MWYNFFEVKVKNMKDYDILIIGGGASGIMAALAAGVSGAKVGIIEKNNRIGKKILVTGNGRCNYTNTLTNKDDYNHPDFVDDIFSLFGVRDTLDFFENIGITPKYEDEGKTYPLSEQASSFLDVFLYEISKRKIDIELNQEISSVYKKKDRFIISSKQGDKFSSKKLIIATGGSSMPMTGSNGSGYELARMLRHSTTDVFPALVKLKVDSPYLKHLSGLKLNTKVDLLVNDEVIQSEIGDILFANYGVSGPTILELSRKANEYMRKNINPQIRIELLQTVSKSKLLDRFALAEEKEISQSLVGLINKRLINVVLNEAGVDKFNMKVKDLDKAKLFKLIDLLYDLRFKVTDSLGFADSQVTAGGVSIDEINSKTLESKLVEGLYFTGEVLDIDGRCGGFNLQWAWSSGYLAGLNALKGISND